MAKRLGTVYSIGLSVKGEHGVRRLDLLVMAPTLEAAIEKAQKAVDGSTLIDAQTTVFDGVVE